MTSRVLPAPPASLRPPSTDSHGTGAAMSVLAHAALVGALALGVQWHTNEPDGVEAELWAATPEFAAPRVTEPDTPPPQPTPAPPPPPVRTAPPPPPPPPAVQSRADRDADIAIERAEKLRLEKERQAADDQRARERRLQAEREKKAEAEKERQQAKLKAEQLAQQKADAERKAEQDEKRKADQQVRANADKLSAQQAAQREKMRQDQMRRMQAQLGGTGAPNSPGTAARTSGPSSSYAGRVRAYIKAQNKGLLTSDVPGNPTAEVEVTLAIDGTIRSTRLVKSSGSPTWDDLAVRAVERTGTLPLDVGGTTPTTMVISLRPNE